MLQCVRLSVVKIMLPPFTITTWGRWNRETWQLGTISQGWISRDCTTRRQIKHRNGSNIRRPKKKSNVLNDKRIKSCLSRFDSGAWAYSRLQFLRAVTHSVRWLFNIPSAQEKNWTCWTISERIKSCLSRFYSGACSFCVQSAILLALIRSLYSRGSTTEVTATAARTKTRTGMALAVSAAPTSGATESATAAAETTSDDCCEVCIVAPRAGFALVPCGHRTRTRRRNDDKENF